MPSFTSRLQALAMSVFTHSLFMLCSHISQGSGSGSTGDRVGDVARRARVEKGIFTGIE